MGDPAVWAAGTGRFHPGPLHEDSPDTVRSDRCAACRDALDPADERQVVIAEASLALSPTRGCGAEFYQECFDFRATLGIL